MRALASPCFPALNIKYPHLMDGGGIEEKLGLFYSIYFLKYINVCRVDPVIVDAYYLPFLSLSRVWYSNGASLHASPLLLLLHPFFTVIFLPSLLILFNHLKKGGFITFIYFYKHTHTLTFRRKCDRFHYISFLSLFVDA